MIFELPETNFYAWTSAFNTKPHNVEELLRNAAKNFPELNIQLVDLDKVPGQRYMKLATFNACKSFHSKQPIAKSLAMELLLYISGDKQIIRALKRVGITPETRRTAAIVVGGSLDQVQAGANFLSSELGQDSEDELLNDWPPKRIANIRFEFDIGEKELEAVIRENETEPMAIERLAVERSAILAAKK